MPATVQVVVIPNRLNHSKTLHPTVKLLETILNDLDYNGHWRMAFIEQRRWKSPENFKVVRQNGDSIICRTKPGGNETSWEISITPPPGYHVGDVVEALSKVGETPVPAVPEQEPVDLPHPLGEETPKKKRNRKTGPQPTKTGYSLVVSGPLNNLSNATKGLLAVCYASNAQGYCDLLSALQVVTVECDLNAYANKVGDDTPSLAKEFLENIVEKGYLSYEREGVKTTPAGHQRIADIQAELPVGVIQRLFSNPVPPEKSRTTDQSEIEGWLTELLLREELEVNQIQQMAEEKDYDWLQVLQAKDAIGATGNKTWVLAEEGEEEGEEEHLVSPASNAAMEKVLAHQTQLRELVDRHDEILQNQNSINEIIAANREKRENLEIILLERQHHISAQQEIIDLLIDRINVLKQKQEDTKKEQEELDKEHEEFMKMKSDEQEEFAQIVNQLKQIFK